MVINKRLRRKVLKRKIKLNTEILLSRDNDKYVDIWLDVFKEGEYWKKELKKLG